MHAKSRIGTTTDAASLLRLGGSGSGSTAGEGMKSPIGTISRPRIANMKISSKLRNGRSLGCDIVQRSPRAAARIHQVFDVALLLIREFGQEQVLAPSGGMRHQGRNLASRSAIIERQQNRHAPG